MSSRDHALDATRTFAIWFMIVCHVARLITKSTYRFPNTTRNFSRLHPSFTQADTDASKTLDVTEFSQLFTDVPSEILQTVFTSCDTSQNGLLTYREFFKGAEKVQLRPTYMQFSLDIEPLCQALFMTMVGVSMLYSLQLTKHKETWQGKQIWRAGELYGIGFVFFVVQDGLQWPWMFIGHGILLSISSAIILCLPLVRNVRYTYVAFLALWSSLLTLNIMDIRIGFVNAGNGPFMPHVILSVFGVIAGGILLHNNKKHQRIFIGLMAILLVGCLSFFDFLDHFTYPEDLTSPYGRRDYKATYHMSGTNGITQIWALIQGSELTSVVKVYYNYTAISILLLMPLCTGVYLFFKSLGSLTEKLSPLWSVGRHSLGVYILHLILVALCTVIFGSVSPFASALEINSAFGIILAICYGYAFLKERNHKKK